MREEFDTSDTACFGKWEFFIDGDKTGSWIAFNGTTATTRVAAGSNVTGGSVNLDSHFTNIQKISSNGVWNSWSSGSSCPDPYYVVQVVDQDNIWVKDQ